MSSEEVKARGWKELDIILVTGDAYVDHSSFGTAIIGRVLEDAGFRVGILLSQDGITWRILRNLEYQSFSFP